MPEEKKKESFTFSDKIKNSKPASSKSFANRASSKIGSDGKPRQTLFERTKRDAPFFIAALVALLLLPFLYKYSGSVDEEPTMVTPSYEDSAFNPERSGFDGFAGDPEGQIAQLAGRDSMSLILPFGGAKNTEEEIDDYDETRMGYAGEGSSASHSLDEQDEEENTTNIYKYRKRAPVATRAAFKRSATKINRLPGAGRAGVTGSKLGVGMWGGGMKSAANKVRGQAPQNAPKPVSLQPLQAAGKPSRSYFGQGAAREAARSKDAMSKGNAMQALMDAQMKPVEPGKIGGILGGDFGGPGGGNGDLKREFLYNGKEPWWWDMMKQRAMMEWQKKFEYKWGWINWATDFARNILGGLLNCLITGHDDGKMGHMFGYGAGGKADPTCCGYTAKKLKPVYGEISDLEAFCTSAMKAKMQKDLGVEKCEGYKGGDSAESATAWGARLNCFGVFASGRKARIAANRLVTEQNQCTTFYQTGSYRAVGGEKRTLYHYVVGVPFDQVTKFFAENDPDKREEMLQIAYFAKGDSFVVDSTEAQQKINKRKFMPLFIESVAIKNRKVNKKTSGKDLRVEFDEVGDDEYAFLTGSDAEKVGLKYTEFLDKLRKGGVVITTNQKETPIISAKGSKRGKSWNTGARCAYPLAFVSCRNHALYAENANPANGETVTGTPAAFIRLPNLTAKHNDAQPSAADLNKMTPHFAVMYEIQGTDNNGATGLTTEIDPSTGRLYYANIHSSSEGYDDEHITNDHGTDFQPNDSTYTVKVEGKGIDALNQMGLNAPQAKDQKRAVITWTVRQLYDEEKPWAIASAIANGQGVGASERGTGAKGSGAKAPGQIVSTATCVYFDDDGVSSKVKEEPECPSDQTEYCCRKWHPQGDYVWKNGRCEKVTTPEPDPKPNPNPNPNPGQSQSASTRLARVFAWVPNVANCRNEVAPGKTATKDSFCPEKEIPVGNDDQHCVEPAGQAIMDSNTAKEFVTQVVAKYNAENSTKPIDFDGSFPTAGEFVDALNIATEVGINQVAKSAVCELGRNMIRLSKDKHYQQPGWHNEFGAFYVYTGEEAVLYPGKHYGDSTTCDSRFMGVQEGSCTRHAPFEFHHNEYTWQGWGKRNTYGSGIEYFKKSRKELADKAGNMAGDVESFPLRALMQDGLNGFTGLTDCLNKGAKVKARKNGRTACGTEVNKFKGRFGFLVDGSKDGDGGRSGQGLACSSLRGDMNVADALKYVKTACKVGLDFKPWGMEGSGSGRSLSDAGSNTADPQVKPGA